MRPLASYAESKTVVPLTLSQALLERLNHLALERGINRSALIRAAIEATYFAPSTPPAQRDAAEATSKGGAA